ncbi:MAG: hypothetical protein JWO82_3703, partial [Akkermansiaceae bacterium]|nr:hypothetical protein [Akkermansiaceae bacterium]
NYRFVVNYYGGSGNDLVLQWADTIAAGWGANDQGQLGAATGREPWLSPTKIAGVGKDRGVTLFATSAGYLHSLALDSDGVVSTWGSNLFGALGTGDGVSHAAPAAVDASGVLAGKRVVAIAAGGFHSLALGSDGTVVAWGYNNFGQLGNGTTTTSGVPVAVDVSGALAGKTVVEIAAGQYHSLALCSDGTLVTWGLNGAGALGDGTTTNRPVPVAVDLSGATSPVASIAAGGNQSFALLQDGSLLAWGFNDHGQLGDGTTTTRLSPVLVTVAGPLTDRKVTGIAAGYAHTVVLLNDGTLAAWGINDRGQLGDGMNGDRLVPVTVSAGALAGKTVVSAAAGKDYTLALCADGTLAAWGANAEGELGQGGGGDSNLPVAVLPGSLGVGARFSGVTSSFASSQHVLATVALPESSAPSALQIKSSPVPVTLADWRLAHFSTAENAGDAADLADPDHDGVTNLMEYAFNLDPKKSDLGSLPVVQARDGELVIEFTAPETVTGILYGASTATGPAGPWQALPDEGVAPLHRFHIPMDRTHGFMRLEIGTAP